MSKRKLTTPFEPKRTSLRFRRYVHCTADLRCFSESGGREESSDEVKERVKEYSITSVTNYFLGIVCVKKNISDNGQHKKSPYDI